MLEHRGYRPQRARCSASAALPPVAGLDTRRSNRLSTAAGRGHQDAVGTGGDWAHSAAGWSRHPARLFTLLGQATPGAAQHAIGLAEVLGPSPRTPRQQCRIVPRAFAEPRLPRTHRRRVRPWPGEPHRFARLPFAV